MTRIKSVLAIIPARGGSKRLPGKNIKLLGGLPLIGWTIKAALSSECFVDVLVSTDDPAIAEVSKQQGASVPWLRPAELATDFTPSIDVVLHALDAWEQANGSVDAVVLLQPTSPFRTMASIRSAVEQFLSADGLHPVVSVSPTATHPAWCFRMTEDGMEPFLGWDKVSRRSQDLEPAWALNGAIYIMSSQRLRQDKAFLTHDAHAFVMADSSESIDVDTANDFAVCEAVVSDDRRIGS